MVPCESIQINTSLLASTFYYLISKHFALSFFFLKFIIHLPQYRSVLYTTDICTSFTLQSTQHRYLPSAVHYLDCLSTSNNAKAILRSFLRSNSEVRNNGERIRQSHQENARDTLLSTRQILYSSFTGIVVHTSITLNHWLYHLLRPTFPHLFSFCIIYPQTTYQLHHEEFTCPPGG